MCKKILLSLAATLIFFSGNSSSLTFASEANKQNYTKEKVVAPAKELQFYFEEVGHIYDNGNYYIVAFLEQEVFFTTRSLHTCRRYKHCFVTGILTGVGARFLAFNNRQGNGMAIKLAGNPFSDKVYPYGISSQ